MDRYGFPRTSAKRSKVVRGFRTGDLVRAEVPRGKKAGVYEGRVAVRASGSFNVRTARGVVQGSRGGTAGFCKRPTVTATVQTLLCYRQASKGGSSPWLKLGVSAPKGEKDDEVREKLEEIARSYLESMPLYERLVVLREALEDYK